MGSVSSENDRVVHVPVIAVHMILTTGYGKLTKLTYLKLGLGMQVAN